MAIVHDVIPPFQLFQPASVDDALELLEARGEEAWVLAGGMDSFDWLKDRTKRTSAVIELSQIGELQGIREANGGFEIGAMTTLTEIAEHAGIRERFGILAEAAGLVASPQIRNQGTLGGNISQDTRCWYLPPRLALLPRGREHLLRRHAHGHQPRARDPRRRPVRGGEPLGHGTGADRARRAAGDSTPRQRARRRGGRLLHGAGHRHHAHDRAAARRAAHGHSHSRDLGGRALLLREGARSAGVGLPAGERGIGDQGRRQPDCGGTHRRRRRRGDGRCASRPSNRPSPASRSTRRPPRWRASWPSQALRRCATTATRFR